MSMRYALASRLHKETHLALGGVRVRLSIVESSDLRRLTLKRQRAIRAFWSAYLCGIRATVS